MGKYSYGCQRCATINTMTGSMPQGFENGSQISVLSFGDSKHFAQESKIGYRQTRMHVNLPHALPQRASFLFLNAQLQHSAPLVAPSIETFTTMLQRGQLAQQLC